MSMVRDMETSPVILSMDVHCRQCASTITRSIINAFVVHRVVASQRMHMVLVYGGARLDPAALRLFLQRLGEARHISHGGGAFMGRVNVVSAGGRPNLSHFEETLQQAPTPPTYALPPCLHAYPPPPPPPYSKYGDGARWLRRFRPRRSIFRDGISTSFVCSQN